MEKNKKGAFQLSRDLFEHELWLRKPSAWIKIWIYILGKVSYKDRKDFERGEFFFNFSQERKCIGNDITEDQIKRFLSYARAALMIRTTRSTRGVVVKVLNYSEYQTMSKSSRTSPRTRETREKHERNTPINKKGKKGKKGKNNTSAFPFEFFWELYDKKVDRLKSEKKWNGLSEEAKEAIMGYLPKYKEAQPVKKYRKNPITFFNNRSWEDEEFIDNNTNTCKNYDEIEKRSQNFYEGQNC